MNFVSAATRSKAKTSSDDHPTPDTPRVDSASKTPKLPGGKRGVGRPKRQGKCYVGHEMTPENTYTTPKGWDTCRECNRALWRNYYYRERRQSVRKSK